MYTDELIREGRKKVINFIGVFPLDKLPEHISHIPCRFIVNTHTKNLPGQHWIAVSYESGGIVYAFDPLGCFYPSKLSNYLAQSGNRRVVFNRIMYQNPFEKNCGQHCLNWLRSRNYKHIYV